MCQSTTRLCQTRCLLDPLTLRLFKASAEAVTGSAVNAPAPLERIRPGQPPLLILRTQMLTTALVSLDEPGEGSEREERVRPNSLSRFESGPAT